MSTKLYVGNLPFKLTQSELQEVFSSCGTVSNVHVPTDRDTGKQKGFAFIEMSSSEDADSAINQLNGAVIGGRNITVTFALDKPGYSANKPDRISNIGQGNCALCYNPDTLYGFPKESSGICPSCITSLSKALRYSQQKS